MALHYGGVFGRLYYYTKRRLVSPLYFFTASFFLFNAYISFYRYLSLKASITFLSYALIAYFASQLDARQKRATLVAFIVLGAGLSLYGLYQYAFGMGQAIGEIAETSHPLRNIIIGKLESGRVFARFSLPGEYACFLAMVIPLCVGLFVSEKTPLKRNLLLLTAGFLCINLFLTQSFGGIAVLVFAGGIMGILHFGRLLLNYKTALYALAGLFVICFIVLGIYFVRAPSGWADKPVNMRLKNWQVAVQIFKERPLTGSGWGGYGLEYPRFRAPAMNETQFAHNTYLQILTEGGIFALGFIFYFFWKWGKRVLDMIKSNLTDTAVCTGVLAFLLYNLIDFQFYLPGAAYPFFILCGVFLRTRKNLKLSEQLSAEVGFYFCLRR